MADNVIGTIEGTATFNRVVVEPAGPDTMHVTGFYGESVTTYGVPKDGLFIEGIPAAPEGEDGEFVLEPEEDDGFLWLEATEDELHVTKEERDD